MTHSVLSILENVNGNSTINIHFGQLVSSADMAVTDVEEGEKVPRAVMMYPWQSFPYQPGPGSMSPVIPPLPVMPTSLSKHPQLWTKEEVAVWLKWCVEEYSIAHISAEKFNMNGKALCLLVRSDFMERVPDVGDILYNVLQKLISRNSGPVLYQPLPTYPTITTGNSVYATPSSCSLSVPRRDNTYLVVPGNTTRTNIIQTRSNYIPILPDLKKSIQSRDNGPKYPIPITPYRMQAPHPPDNVLSPAPSGGSDSSQSDRHSDSPSPSSNDICHNGFAESRPFPEGSLETESPAPHGLTGYDRPLTQPSSPVWREKNTDSKTSERGCDMAFGELGKLGFNSNFAYRQARTGDCRLLWEFINYLLVNGTYPDYIRWEDRDKLTFRIINPTALAELWGIQKNRTNMTYEKLSRALRYYYRMNIIKKVTGKRLTYQFLRQPKDIKKGQRGARPQQRPAMSQYPFPAGLSGLHGSDDHSVKQDSRYIADTVYRAIDDHAAAEERLRNGEHPLPSEPSRTSELFPSEERSRGEQRCDCESSPSPPIPPPPQQSPVGSISYSGTAEMVTFPVQDEPEDLSLKAGSPERPSIKQEPMETKHDVNSNLTNKECPGVLSTPGSVKLEPDADQMETNS